MIPIRCFTCNKVIGNKWETYLFLKQQEYTEQEIYNQLKIRRFCCKRMFSGMYIPYTNNR